MSACLKNDQRPNGDDPATDGSAPTGMPEPASGGKEGRGAGGRFARGNPGGPGNPFARQVAQFRAALLDTVTVDDIRHMARQLVVLAKSGNVSATKLVFAYVIGKPAPAVNPDALDREELLQRLRFPPLKEVLQKINGHFRPEHLVGLDRAMAIGQRLQLAERIEEHSGASRGKTPAKPAVAETPAAEATPAVEPEVAAAAVPAVEPAPARPSTPGSRRAAAILQQLFRKAAGLPPRPGKKRRRR